MKKLYLLVIFFLNLISAFSQTGFVTLTFIGEDADTQNNLPLESVYIKNTTLGCDTTIYGATPSIFLLGPSGIRELAYSMSDPFIIIPPVPNPFDGTTHVDIHLNEAGTLHITVLDAQGKIVSEYNDSFKIGIHNFQIESLVPGLLLLNVSNGRLSKSMKLINNNNGIGVNRITCLGSEHQNLKSNPSVSGFTFRIGDQLLYKSIKSAYYDKILIDSPVQNSSYTFELKPIIIEASVITTEATNITQNTAASGGDVSSDGGAPVTARGICWSTSLNPTTADNHTINGSDTGTFVSNMTGLTGGALYHVRAYATNSAGTSYGNELSFTTLTFPAVTTDSVTNITETSAISGGMVASDGGSPVTTRGICWSTSSNPTNSDSHTINGSDTGTFVSNMTGLTGGTLYHVRAYAINSTGTSYGNELTFATLTFPTVTTDTITNVTENTAIGSGTVISDGGSPVTARGVCWSISSTPTIANSHTTSGIGTGSFESNLTNLSVGTFYYVRAYATNSLGTSYGNELTFITLTFPMVTTDSITNLTENTAIGWGTITSDGGTPVTARGICWSTSSNPTILGSHTSNGTGIGNFLGNMTGLASETYYYVRAYATNNLGISYGNEMGFTTSWACGTFLIINHEEGPIAPVTKTVTYGTVTNIPGESSKCWITSNLGADHQASSVDDPTEASAGWYWQFNRKQGYKHDGTTRTPNTTWITSIDENFDWQAANDPCSLELGSGWRIPTATEWIDVDEAGSWSNWIDAWNSELKLHAAGFLYPTDGLLYARGSGGSSWSCSQSSPDVGKYLNFYSANSFMSNGPKADGLTLRCIKE